MTDEKIVKISKYLSRHLRHAPERIGLTLEPGGWVPVEDLLAACARNRFPISRTALETVVAENDKHRFSFDETGTRIRANQGHSIDVDLELALTVPPEVLYHGTAENVVDAIRRAGIQKMRRHHVHLSVDTATAIKVGSRHGKPVVLVVDAQAMQAAGHRFYVSDNGVWLTDHVPPEYLKEKTGFSSLSPSIGGKGARGHEGRATE